MLFCCGYSQVPKPPSEASNACVSFHLMKGISSSKGAYPQKKPTEVASVLTQGT